MSAVPVSSVVMDDELEGMELQYLRQQALNTQKQRRRPPAPIPLPHDPLLGIEELFKVKRSQKKTTPEIAQEVIDTFHSQIQRNKRSRPSSSVKGPPKRARRISSASSSHSSYTTSTRSRSRSSYSTSRSTSRSRSRSSASSRSSSYSNSRSNSYSRSSVSPSQSSRSRSRSPVISAVPSRSKSRKVHSTGSAAVYDKLDRGAAEKHRTHRTTSRRGVGRDLRVETSPHSDWYHQQQLQHHSERSVERRSQRSVGVDRHARQVVSTDDSFHHHRREGRHRSPQHQRADEEVYLSRSGSRRHHPISPPRPLSPLPLSSRHRTTPLHPASPSPRSHHRHLSPPPSRERRVVSRQSPPITPLGSSGGRGAGSSHRLHPPRDHTNEHRYSPRSGRRRSPSPPPPLSRRDRESRDRPRMVDRERRVDRDRDQERPLGRERRVERERNRGLEREKERERGLDRGRDRTVGRERERGLERDRVRGLNHERERGLDRERERGPDRERERGPDHERERGPDRERERGPDRERRERGPDRERDRGLDRDRDRAADRERVLDRERRIDRERAGDERERDRRREDRNSGRRESDVRRDRSPRQADTRIRKDKSNSEPRKSRSSHQHNHSAIEEDHIDDTKKEHNSGSKEKRRRSSKTSSVMMAVLDSLSPKQQSALLESSPMNGADEEKSIDLDKVVSERDLLGDYDFNPFVDEELDYDEDMEDFPPADSAPEPIMREEGEEEEEEGEGEIVEDGQDLGDQDVLEVNSPAGSLHSSPSKEPDQVSNEDITSCSDTEEKLQISSPIRVTPDRDTGGRRGDRRGGIRRRSGDRDAKIPVKERLFVSKKTILEKKKSLGRSQTESLRPSLANRLGPPSDSPGGRRSVGSKGSAVEIAEAYRRKRLEEERLLHSESKQKSRMSKMLNSGSSSSSSRDRSRQQRKLSPIPDSVDKERALDRRISEIQQNNKAIEQRKKEIEKDKLLHA